MDLRQKYIIFQDQKTKHWIVCTGIIGFMYTWWSYESIHDIPQKNRLYRRATKQEIESFNNDSTAEIKKSITE